MADLRIDGDDIETAITELRVVEADLLSAQLMSDATASYTGHEGLASKVRDFASSWRIQRDDMQTAVRSIGGALTTIRDEFQQVDSELAGALTNGTQ